MDEKDFELLSELYQLKNITKVSQKLFITQPALTKRIKKIEEELNVQLLLRSKKGVIFTPAGENIIPYARQILKLSEEMRNRASMNQETVCGTLSFGTSLNFSRYRLPAILKEYTKTYPDVDIQVVTSQSKTLYRRLQKDEIYIAIVRGRFNWDEGRILLSQEPMCFVCSHENADKPLKDYPFIARHTDINLQERIIRWLEEHDLSSGHSRLQIDDIDSCKEMARLGLGWSILPQICLQDYDGYIKELHFADGTPFVRSTYLLYKNSYYELPQVRLFIDCLVHALDAPVQLS